jgi:class 3 adenylate cyclase
MNVLVAEDHPESRQILIDVLTASGYRVLSATNGRDALLIARDELPDLAILDVNMPGIDGFEVCATLKQDPATEQIHIIMLTAQSDVESRVRGLGLGADDYVSKPFSPKELLARVDTRLRAKAQTDVLRQQRIRLRKTFERFVSPDIVDALMQNPEAAQLGGALREITVMFADMEGFTTLSEHIDPVELLTILNEYHGLMVEIIKRNGGTIDKLLGDGIMAIYNAPVELENHALSAVTTACEIRDALPEFQLKLPAQFRLGVNFGIHTGNAVVGNVGSADVMDYTAIGDTVNLAARLQVLSDNGAITISEATFNFISDSINADNIGHRQIRGREGTVNIFEVVNLRQSVT